MIYSGNAKTENGALLYVSQIADDDYALTFNLDGKKILLSRCSILQACHYGLHARDALNRCNIPTIFVDTANYLTTMSGVRAEIFNRVNDVHIDIDSALEIMSSKDGDIQTPIDISALSMFLDACKNLALFNADAVISAFGLTDDTEATKKPC